MRVLFGLGLVVLAIGCAPGPSGDPAAEKTEKTDTARSAIIAGKTSPASQDYVVALASRPGGKLSGLCSGTLVAPNVVLTALHCVSDTNGPIGCNGAGQPVDGYTRNDYLAEDLFIYRGANAVDDIRADREEVRRAAARGVTVITESSTAFCNSDLAFIVLDKEMKGPYAPIRLKTAPKKSEKLTAIGFGLDESGKTAATRMERGGLEVIEVGPALLSEELDYGIGESEFVIGESACNGDSGGPVISDASGAVIGVTSRVGGGDGGGLDPDNDARSCAGDETRAIYTHLKDKKLVEQAFSSARKPMWLEGEPNPFLFANGAACSESVECRSSVCNEKLCAKRCDDGQACGADETCTARDGVKICIKSATAPSSTPPSSDVASQTTTGDEVTPPSETTSKLVFGCSASSSTSDGPIDVGAPAVAGLLGLAALISRRRGHVASTQREAHWSA